ncbi:MAG: hypothetical protein NVSMB38_30750 [Ktedonobacteraceae bacterium]
MGKQFFDAGLARRRRYLVDAPVQVEIVLGTHALVESRKLQQRSTAGANGLGLGAGIKAKDPGLTPRWFQQAKQQMDGRGFARPIWPEKPKDNACWYPQREIIDRFDGAKEAGKVFDVDKWFWHNFPFNDTR